MLFCVSDVWCVGYAIAKGGLSTFETPTRLLESAKVLSAAKRSYMMWHG